MTPALGIVLAAMVADMPVSETSSSGPPAEIVGTWDVVRVAVDSEDALHWEFRPDDPQVLGRTLFIESERVRFHHGKRIDCKQSVWRPRQATWGFLFARGFIRTEEGGNQKPSPDDFDIKVAKNQPAKTYSLCPQSGSKASQFPRDHWVAQLAPGRLALHYDNQVLLVLRRRPANAEPTASFDCAKAATATEKTICGSFDLASMDRSVALAFRRVLERQTPQKLTELHQAQKEWLQKRDACGSDADCIDDQQWQRVEELSYQ